MKVNMVGAVRSMVGQRAALAVKVVSYARNDSEGRYRKSSRHRRSDKPRCRWVRIGFFLSAWKARIAVQNDVHNVYVYNDCTKDNVPKGSETKKVWVKTNLKFSDEVPRDNQQGYEEVTFVRLTSGKYTISAN